MNYEANSNTTTRNQETNEYLKNYTHNLINFRPDFLKMIYDSYNQFDYEELTHTINLNNNNHHLHKDPYSSESGQVSDKKQQKGFYTSIEQFLDGNELDKWREIIQKLISSQNKEIGRTRGRTQVEIKHMSFMKLDEIPKIPERKFTEKSDFNFKSKNEKIISFSSSSSIIQEKVNPYVKEVFNNSGSEKIIKLTDTYRDNKIVFLEKIEIEENDTNLGNPLHCEIKSAIDLKSLESRSDILLAPRLQFIEKVATVVCKFLISLKKLYKIKKEKEKVRDLRGGNNYNHNNHNHNIYNTNANAKSFKEGYNTLIKNLSMTMSTKELLKDSGTEKLKKVREIVSLSSMKTLLNSTNKKNSLSLGNNDIHVNKFRKLLYKKVEEKEKTKKIEKLGLIKDKIRDLIENEYYGGGEVKEFTPEIQKDEVNNFDSNFNHRASSMNSINDSQTFNEEKNRKRRTLHNTQIVDLVNDFKEEKTILPKKKVNFSALKMFVKEEMTKTIKK
jgi:hypothetical protein